MPAATSRITGALDVRAREIVRNRHIGAAAHGIGGTGEQRLDLEIVELRRALAEIAVGLEVEVLAVVARQVLPCPIDLAVAAFALAL